MFTFVYILTNKDNRIYIGCTENLKERYKLHNDGKVPSTKFYKPWKIKSYFAFEKRSVAFRFEKYLKSGTGKEFFKKHFRE